MADDNLIEKTPSNGAIIITNNNNNNNNNNNLTIKELENGKKLIKDVEENTEVIHSEWSMKAIVIMFGAFLCCGIIFGVINSYGMIHTELMEALEKGGDSKSSSKSALVGSLTIGSTFLFSSVSGMLVDKIGLRMTTFIGGVFTTFGMLIASFYLDNIPVLCLSYGFMFGFGSALAYTPSLAILGHYFKRYLGLVSGFVTAGSSIFTIILPYILKNLNPLIGLSHTLHVLTLLCSIIIISSLLYKPLLPPPEKPRAKPGRSKCSSMIKSVIYVENWKKKRYLIWAISIPIALFGYFVPYVHIVEYVKQKFPGEDSSLPLMCIGVASGIGRILFGYIADFPKVNRIFLQQIAFVMMGISIMLIPATNSFILLLVIFLAMGLFDGCFISLLGPIAYDICGSLGATQAIGFLLGLCSIPLTLGPILAGILYDYSKSYTLSFILSGIPCCVGALTMFLIRFVKDETVADINTDPSNQPLAKVAWDAENGKVKLNDKLVNGNGRAAIASAETLASDTENEK